MLLMIAVRTDWENCLVQDYKINETEAQAILAELPVEMIENGKMFDLFKAKTREVLPAKHDEVWNKDEDALCAAPESHLVLANNDRVRVLKVTVLPGKKEPFHTHEWSSIMVVAKQSSLIYFTQDSQRNSNPPIGIYQLPPEKLHAVENTGTTEFKAIRFEIKGE
jgi:hypothetical protein